MEDKLGVGIHGAGQAGRQHAKAYIDNPYAQIVGVSSRHKQSAQVLVQELGLQCTVFEDYDQLLADDRIEVVSVCTPNYQHAQQAIAAAQAGKHLVLEKPVGMTLEELRALRRAVEQAGIKSIVSFVLRWNLQVASMKQLIESGAVGDVFYAECDYWHGIFSDFPSFGWLSKKAYAGSGMISGGCHAVDMLRYLVGEIVEVAAFSTSRCAEYEYPTTVVASLQFAGNAVGKVSSCLEAHAPYTFNIYILGTQGTLRDDRIYLEGLLPGQTHFATVPTARPDSGSVEHHPFKEEINDFFEALRTGGDASPDILDAIKTQEVCLAIDQSLEAGQIVKLPLI